MENIGVYFAWAAENWEAVIGILVAVHAAALGIVNLTPTPADDEVVGKAYKVIEFLAGIFGQKAKLLPGEVPAVAPSVE